MPTTPRLLSQIRGSPLITISDVAVITILGVRQHGDPDAIPAELIACDQWVIWRLEPTDDSRPTKVPYRAATPGMKASTTDPETWGSYEAALAAAERDDVAGIGFVFTPRDPFAGIDLDGCFTGDCLHEQAAWVVSRLDSYAERSPSRTGLHVIVRARLTGGRKRTDTTPWGGKFETYDAARFFTVTGEHLAMTPPQIEARQEQLDRLREELLPEPHQATDRRVGRVTVSTDDAELLERARNAKNGREFHRLWGGDTSAYEGDDSRADLALCGHLAYWCGRDPDRIDRLFRRSGLMRTKWDSARGESTYGQRTVDMALVTPINICSARPKPLTRSSGSGHPIDAAGVADPPNSSRHIAANDSGARGDASSNGSGGRVHLFPTTDLGNAERLVARHGADVRYVIGRGWFAWNRHRWRRDDDGEVMRRAKLTARSILSEAQSVESEDERKRLAEWAIKSETESRLRAAVSLAQFERPVIVRANQLDADQWLLNARNGTIDLRTGELQPHDRADLITKLAGADYDRFARSARWESFLDRTTGGDQELRAFVQRVAGYTIAGVTDEEILAFAHGPGATGKSTFVEAIKSALGDYATTADFETFLARRGDAGVRNDIARLAGARMVLSVEVEDGARLAEGLVKTDGR